MIMNKQEFLTHAGLQVQTLELWLDQRWLVPNQTSAEITSDRARSHNKNSHVTCTLLE